jgi:hypothetical protein
MARRPDGRGRGLLRRHAGEKRRSIRGTPFCGLRILLVLNVECRVVLQRTETRLLDVACEELYCKQTA